MRKLGFMKYIALACTVSIMLAGCGKSVEKSETTVTPTNTPATTQAAVPTQTPSAGTITITDAKGEVEIPATPARIVDISGNSDILSILGYSVVGTANSDAYDYTKFPAYLEETLKGAQILGYSMQDTMDIEGILSLEPDLIIMSKVQEKMYDQLKEIAPTVMIELAQTNWKDDVNQVATVMNQSKKATAWLQAYETKAAQIGSEVKEINGEDVSYLAFLASGGQIYIFDKAGIGSILFEDMGLNRPSGLPEQENISLPVVTYEGLASIDADYIIAVGTKEDLKLLNESPIYNSIEAVSNGHVAQLPASPYFNMGYSSIGRNLFLDEIVGLVESMNE